MNQLGALAIVVGGAQAIIGAVTGSIPVAIAGGLFFIGGAIILTGSEVCDAIRGK